MALPDPAEIIQEIKNATSGILNKDVQTVRGFSERQVRMMARQAVWIAEATLAHEFDDDPDLRDDFLDNLQHMATDYGHTLRGLVAVTTEKIINATIEVLWKAIEKAVGFSLPRPL